MANECALRYFTDQVHYIHQDVTFASPAGTVIGVVPNGSLILKPLSGVQVNTAFNAGSTNVLDIGTTANDDLYGTDMSLATVTFVPIDEAVSLKLTDDTTFTFTYAQTGTAATAGEGVAVIAFIPPKLT